jgi:hypothetical protein
MLNCSGDTPRLLAVTCSVTNPPLIYFPVIDRKMQKGP